MHAIDSANQTDHAIEEPDDLRASLAATKCDDVPTDRVIEQGALVFIRLSPSR